MNLIGKGYEATSIAPIESRNPNTEEKENDSTVHEFNGEETGNDENETTYDSSLNNIMCENEENIFPSPQDINSTANHSNNYSNSQGQKRPHDDNSSSLSEGEIKKYKEEWIPKPKHPDVIQYFVEISNILANQVDIVDTTPFLIEIMDALKMSEEQLKKCHKKTQTATARCLIRFIFPTPEPSFKLSNVDKFIIDGIIKYSKYVNPVDNASGVEVRRAIGYYFSSSAYNKKKERIFYRKPVSLEKSLQFKYPSKKCDHNTRSIRHINCNYQVTPILFVLF
ncbi:unnamed protein product [Rotaria magnacalcarata]|uniref:Uncharacterized protein n=2 Tax=Rotaria magnacalcarata TaxID=392030 RepID=A0A8S2N5V5_9BILA|nr:unnamed protein product [Rotaria magnacalcarata]CAF4004153.1 unnamed protein product [Rotaria magnacalcarata]